MEKKMKMGRPKKLGRPKLQVKKEFRLIFRVSAGEKRSIIARAREQGMRPSEYIRSIVLN
jgi:hypothetical protein